MAAPPDEVDSDRIAQKVKAAWKAYGELRDVAATQGARDELAMRQMYLERYLADLDQTIGEMQTVVNIWHVNPNRHTNAQEEFYQQLQRVRGERVEADREWKQNRLQFKQLSEEEIHRAQAEDRPVRPMDGERLVEFVAASRRKCLEAYREAKSALDGTGTSRAAHTVALRTAINKLKAGQDAAKLGSPDAFVYDFREFCGGPQYFEKDKEAGKVKNRPQARPRRR